MGGEVDNSGFRPTAVLNLREADFRDAQLNYADFERVNLKGAKFQGATLYNADLNRTDLTGTKLQGTNMNEVGFVSVDLSEANFQDAELERALLCGVDLRGAKNLTQDQLNATDDGDEVMLPESLEKPPSWSKPVPEPGPHGYCGVVQN